MHGSEDNTRYDLDKYPFALSGFAPAHRGEDGQYYLLPGLPILPDEPDTPLPEVWKRRQPGEGECGLPDAPEDGEPESVQDMLRLSRGEKIIYAVVACMVLLLVFRNLPVVREWAYWR